MIDYKPPFFQRLKRGFITLSLFAAAAGSMLSVTAPLSAQDERMSLDGTWNFHPQGADQSTNQVPGFYVASLTGGYTSFPDNENGPWRVVPGHPDAAYWRQFDVPASMSGKNLFIRFESVNYVADIYVNNVFAGTHSGGYVPFEVDITDLADAPSSGNTLRVEIKYNSYRFLEYEEYPVWPTGYYGHAFNLGITGSVHLVSRPDLYISDVFVLTSVENSTISVSLDVINTTDQAQQITLKSHIPAVNVIIGDEQMQLPAADTVTVSFQVTWTNPLLWTPESPHLYVLSSEIFQNGLVCKRENRFGFREFKAVNDHFTLNGTRINLRGDNIVLHSETPLFMYYYADRDGWDTILDSLLALNANVIRFHQQPPPSWMIDACDEKGMMVIAESAIYGTMFPRSPRYLANAKIWLKEWVRRDRNHPSVVVWCAQNEMYSLHQTLMIPDMLRELDEAIRTEDTSRPILFEGAGDMQGVSDITSWHYTIGGFPNGWPAYSMYDFLNVWTQSLENFGMPFDPNTATSHGEFEWSSKALPEQDHAKRQAIKVRVQRYLGIDDIRPYRLDWSWFPVPLDMAPYRGWAPGRTEIEFLRNSLNPLLAFDKAYYEFHWSPQPPEYPEGETVRRTVIVFNDRMSGSAVELRWSVLLNDVVTETGSSELSIQPGLFAETEIEFQAPYTGADQHFKLRLQTVKNGQTRFSETTVFKTLNQGGARPSGISRPSAHIEGSNLYLQWPAVTADEEDNEIEIDHYQITRSSRADFSGSGTTIQVTDTVYTDDLSGIIDQAGQTLFYKIYAIDQHGVISRASEVLAFYTCSLTATDGTSINEIGLPVVLNGINKASEFVDNFSLADALFYWDAEHQGVTAFVPGAGSTDFDLAWGTPVIVNAAESGVIAFAGLLADVSSTLVTTSGTSFNAVMVPLQRTDLTAASHLLADVPSCNGAAVWNAALQGFEQYIPEIPATDFSVYPGGSYYVNVQSSGIWKSDGSSNAGQGTAVSAASAPGPVPHAVWGEHSFSGPVTFKAALTAAPEQMLYPESTGCLLDDRHWVIQCANFPDGWEPGDTLSVTFFNASDEVLFTHFIELTNNPVDHETVVSEVKRTAAPADFRLFPVYPNPFNDGTVITYSIGKPGHVTLAVYDIKGRRIRQLTNDFHASGNYTVRWDGRESGGRPAASGIYIIRLTAGTAHLTEKTILSR